MPRVPLLCEKVAVAYSDRVADVRIGPTGLANSADLSVVPNLDDRDDLGEHCQQNLCRHN